MVWSPPAGPGGGDIHRGACQLRPRSVGASRGGGGPPLRRRRRILSDIVDKAVPRRRGTLLRWGVIAALVVVVAVTVIFASRFGDNPGLVDSPLIDQPAPGFTLERLYEGDEVSLSDYEGEVVVVNFFASWCLECGKEHADLVATAEAFKDSGVRFLAISYQDQPDASRAFLEDLGRSEYTDYLVDSESRTAIAYGVFGIPETFIIDQDGVVVGKIIGESNALVLGDALDTVLAGDTFGTEVAGNQRSDPSDD
ncbi:MAG: redoxin domain-containing protein [Acidimicrobiia bacterium]|nr:redoxin domain-containing protein [Acidimicrobiia bacterium]